MTRSTAGARNRVPAAERTANFASLSVVVVATGGAVHSQSVATALSGAARDFGAQVILVSCDLDPSVASAFECSGAELVQAPLGSSRAEMCDLGMSRARGAIVAVRDAGEVGDARWLEAYRKVLPVRAAAESQVITETVVMDSMVAVKRAIVDSPAAVFGILESRTRIAAIEMAAAV